MRKTIVQAVANRAPTGDTLESWAQREVQPLLQELRARANSSFDACYQKSTLGDAAWTNAWTSDELPHATVWLVTVTIVAKATAIAAGRNAYIRRGLFYREAVGAGQEGATLSVYTNESVAACDVRLQLGATLTNQIQVDVVDAGGGQTMNWNVHVVMDFVG